MKLWTPLLILLLVAGASAATLTQQYTVPNSQSYASASVQLSAIKYDPYPVNPGSWFDIWVQVQNTGEQDATDALFSLSTEHPFTASDTERSFLTIAGKTRAHDMKLPNENTSQANIVLIKYHVYVADDASEGVSTLKVNAQYTPGEGEQPVVTSFGIPITIEKTKTDFTVSMMKSSSRATTFTVANTGEKVANAVTVSVIPTEANLLTGASLATIGSLATGDFTTVTFAINTANNAPNTVHSIDFDVSYTDTGGTRTTVRKSVPVQLAADETPTIVATAPIGSQWVYGIGGLVIGIVVALILSRLARAKA